jgi:acetyl-CoA carboxylase carboxyltransferase component
MAEIAVMGAKGAVEVLSARELKKIEDDDDRAKFLADKEQSIKINLLILMLQPSMDILMM